MTAWWQADWRFWREVDWRSIPDWERSAQRWVLLVNALVVTTGVALVLAWPLWSKLQAVLLAREHVAQQMQLQEVNLLTTGELSQQGLRIQKHLDMLAQRVPAKVDEKIDLHLVNTELETIARRQGIQVSAVRAQTAPSLGPLSVQALELDGVASYRDWGQFLQTLARGPRLMRVSAMHAKGVGEQGEIAMTLTVEAWTRPKFRPQG